MTQPQLNPGLGSTANVQKSPDGNVIQLRPPKRWHDPLQLIQNEAPSHVGRIVLWSVCVLVLILLVWAAVGQLDIIASAEGKLVPQTLVKIVQPAEAGIIKELLVEEGDTVRAGQVIARLDTTVARADKQTVANDLATQKMQARRIEAELANQPMQQKANDDIALYGQIHNQYIAHRQAYLDSVEQEKALLDKAIHERKSAAQILNKLEQTVPVYKQAADSYADLAREGYVPALHSADKQREALEKAKDLEAQKSAVAALNATIAAQQKKLSQLQSSYKSELQKELAELNNRIGQLQPNLDKSLYREGLMELRAPQDGIIKDMATTTVGAVVQPGTVLATLVPQGEKLYADVNIRNDDIGFVQAGQTAQIKLAAYPFQKYGMLSGKVIQVSADATEQATQASRNRSGNSSSASDEAQGSSATTTYKARIELDQQMLKDPNGKNLILTPGMQIVAEINQGKRSVLEYLLSPVRKTVNEAGRER